MIIINHFHDLGFVLNSNETVTNLTSKLYRDTWSWNKAHDLTRSRREKRGREAAVWRENTRASHLTVIAGGAFYRPYQNSASTFAIRWNLCLELSSGKIKFRRTCCFFSHLFSTHSCCYCCPNPERTRVRIQPRKYTTYNCLRKHLKNGTYVIAQIITFFVFY